MLLLGVISTDGPAKRPTGYANANAAPGRQVLGLCGLAMLRADRPRRIVLWVTTVAAVVAVIAANASKAAFVVAVPLVAVVALMSLATRAPYWVGRGHGGGDDGCRGRGRRAPGRS